MIPVIPHILEQDTGGATAKDDPVENGVDDKTKSDPVDGYIKHSDKKVDAVCFVVHGMGKQWEAPGKYHDNLFQLQKTCNESIAEEFEESDANIEWIPVEWHSKLHGLDTADNLMNRITLPTCSIMRKVNNDMLSDVLFYFTSFHGQTVLNIVARELNRLYHKYRETHPHFSGKVAIVGHSLGGIITYDLLSNQVKAVSLDGSPISYPNTDPDARNNATHYPIIYPKLDFEPCHLFALGSPVGAVLIMRGQTFPYYSPQTKTEFHNIFHLYDPMAYRVEPLMDKRFVEISPVLLQRPSTLSKSSFQLSYYRELISAYLQDFSNLASGVKVPQMPNIGINVNLSALSRNSPGSASISIPSLSIPSASSIQDTLSNLSLPVPELPQIPLLSKARESLSQQVSNLYDSISDFWTPNSTESRKRRHRDDTYDSENSNSSNPEETLFPDQKNIEETTNKDDAFTQPPSHKRRELNNGKAHDVRNTTYESHGSEANHKEKVDDESIRLIKQPVSRTKSRSHVQPERTDDLFQTPKRTHPKAPKEAFQHMVAEFGEEWTVKLAQAAKYTQDEINAGIPASPFIHSTDQISSPTTDSLSGASKPVSQDEHSESETGKEPSTPSLHKRVDYFVQESTIDNVVHQYLIGLKAHFGYWNNKDMMHYIVKCLLSPTSSTSDSEQEMTKAET